MSDRKYAPREVAALGRALYEQRIRSLVEPGNKGKYLVIDVETGDYELDQNQVAASIRALAKHPNGPHYLMRIGYPSMGRIGNRWVETKA